MTGLPPSARTFSMPLADGITAELRWTGGPMTKRALDLFRKYLSLYEETISEPAADSRQSEGLDAAWAEAEAALPETGNPNIETTWVLIGLDVDIDDFRDDHERAMRDHILARAHDCNDLCSDDIVTRLAATLEPTLDAERLAEALYLTLTDPVIEPYHGEGEQRAWHRHAKTVIAYLAAEAARLREDPR